MKRFTALLAWSAVVFNAKASLDCLQDDEINFKPFGFLVGLCEHIDGIEEMNELFLTRLLPANSFTRPVILKYRQHFHAVANTTCVELKAHNSLDWEKFLPEDFVADDVYNVLMCRPDFVKSFVFKKPVPRELQGLQASSMDELKWLIENVDILNEAIKKDAQGLKTKPRFV